MDSPSQTIGRRAAGEVCRRLRVALVSTGLSRKAFASLLGTSQPRLSSYLSGKVTPSASFLIEAELVAKGARGGAPYKGRGTSHGVGGPIGGALRPDFSRPGIGLGLKISDAERYQVAPQAIRRHEAVGRPEPWGGLPGRGQLSRSTSVHDHRPGWVGSTP